MYYNKASVSKCDRVAIYIKDNIPNKAQIISENSIINSNTVGISGVYRSPSINVNSFIDDLPQYLDKHCCCATEMLIDDTNTNILSHDYLQTEYYNSLLYISYIDNFTRIENNIKSCIDHIFIKPNLRKNNFVSGILHSSITDHFPQVLCCTFNIKKIRILVLT